VKGKKFSSLLIECGQKLFKSNIFEGFEIIQIESSKSNKNTNPLLISTDFFEISISAFISNWDKNSVIN